MSLETQVLKAIEKHGAGAVNTLARHGKIAGTYAEGLTSLIRKGTLNAGHLEEGLLANVRHQLVNTEGVAPDVFNLIVQNNPKIQAQLGAHANDLMKALPRSPLEVEKLAGRGFWGTVQESWHGAGDLLKGRHFTEAGRLDRSLGQMERAANRQFGRPGSHLANDYAERVNEVIANGHERVFQAKMDKRVDEIVNGKPKKPMGTVTKLALGGGAVAGAIAAGSTLTGANQNNGAVMNEAAEAGAQAALRDTMMAQQAVQMSGQNLGVRGGYNTTDRPAMQVEAANSNYQGRLSAGPQLAMG